MFGITESDILMCEEIHKRGYTVSEAYSRYTSGTLDPALTQLIREYEESLCTHKDRE